MYEYTTEVFAVGLNGFAPVDNDRLNGMSADGWEPAHMAPVHGGFAAVVLFRRETDAATPPTAGTARARKATPSRTRKVPPPAAPVRAPAARSGRASASTKAAGKATPPPRSRPARAR
jgi:hypothetical protein